MSICTFLLGTRLDNIQVVFDSVTLLDLCCSLCPDVGTQCFFFSHKQILNWYFSQKIKIKNKSGIKNRNWDKVKYIKYIHEVLLWLKFFFFHLMNEQYRSFWFMHCFKICHLSRHHVNAVFFSCFWKGIRSQTNDTSYEKLFNRSAQNKSFIPNIFLSFQWDESCVVGITYVY